MATVQFLTGRYLLVLYITTVLKKALDSAPQRQVN